MTRPLRLLTVGHSYTLGVNRRLAHAIQEASAGRWAVTVAAPTYFHGHRDIRPAVLDATPDEPVPVVPVRTYLTSRVHAFLYGRRLRSLLRQQWDLVHCWEEPYVLAGGQVAAWTPSRTPIVFRSAQNLQKAYPPPFHWVERFAVGRAAGWLCSGTGVEANLLSRPGYAQRPHACIPLGVDTTAFRPDPTAGAATRKALGWSADGPPVIGFLGRFVPEKGLGLLMRVLDRITFPWRALLVGGGPMEQKLRLWAAEHSDRVRVVTGTPHAEIPRFVNAMDVLVAPSQTARRWREQFGRMLIEGFSTGIPVVGSDSGEIPHVLAGTGIVVPEADEDAWVAVLSDLLESPEKRADFGRRGVQRARTDFAWPVVGRRHVEFFDAILERAG